MTTLIPDSWELPSYLAGDLVPMNKYRDRERDTLSDEDWAPGQHAQVLDFKRKPAAPAVPAAHWENTLADIESYDPEKHGGEPAELYDQHDLDALEGSGYHPAESGVWHRPITTDRGESMGGQHMISYNPGHRDSENRLIPWHVSTNPDEVGSVYGTLRGPGGALTATDAEVEQLRRTPKHARLYPVGDWLEY